MVTETPTFRQPPCRRMAGGVDYRALPTSTILAEGETLSWDRAEIAGDLDAGAGDPVVLSQTVAYLDHRLGEVAVELNRRDRLRHRPEAPPWPGAWPDRRPDAAAVKCALDLPRFVERFFGVPLERRGKEMIGRCPFPDHDDRTPSFAVNPERQLFHCHGCRRGGDVISLTAQLLTGGSFLDALDLLAGEAGIAGDGGRRGG